MQKKKYFIVRVVYFLVLFLLQSFIYNSGEKVSASFVYTIFDRMMCQTLSMIYRATKTAPSVVMDSLGTIVSLIRP